MNLDDFAIRNTRPDELDNFISILEAAAQWLEDQNVKQWPPGMFSNPAGRSAILTAIDAKQCFMIDHRPVDASSHTEIDSQIAGIFVLNYNDPFDEILWKDFAEDWMDALYLHRLVIQKPFQGSGLTAKVIEYAEEKVKEAGRHYLRMDCIAGNARLRRFYGERCRGREKGGLQEVGTVRNRELGLEFARFEIQVVRS